MSPDEFKFSLLLDRIQSTIESIGMYRPSFENKDPSLVVTQRVGELLNTLAGALDKCETALETYVPSPGELNRIESLRLKTNKTLADFQTMIKETILIKQRMLGC